MKFKESGRGKGVLNEKHVPCSRMFKTSWMLGSFVIKQVLVSVWVERGKPKEPRNPLGEAELVRGDDASSETSLT